MDESKSVRLRVDKHETAPTAGRGRERGSGVVLCAPAHTHTSEHAFCIHSRWSGGGDRRKGEERPLRTSRCVAAQTSCKRLLLTYRRAVSRLRPAFHSPMDSMAESSRVAGLLTPLLSPCVSPWRAARVYRHRSSALMQGPETQAHRRVCEVGRAGGGKVGSGGGRGRSVTTFLIRLLPFFLLLVRL